MTQGQTQPVGIGLRVGSASSSPLGCVSFHFPPTPALPQKSSGTVTFVSFCRLLFQNEKGARRIYVPAGSLLAIKTVPVVAVHRVVDSRPE